MRWWNVQDMPIDHNTRITKVEELQEIAQYCRNDVASTKAIMNLNKDEISLRANLTNTYDINLYSASEPRISKELFLHFFANKTGITKNEIRQLRTFRNTIKVKSLILPYTSFKTPIFQELLKNFQQVLINPNETKNSFKYSIKYRGVTTDFGLGGVHGVKKGIYESDEYMTIMSSDVNFLRLNSMNCWNSSWDNQQPSLRYI